MSEQRLFFALLPDAVATNSIANVQRQLPQAKLQMYRAENLHQTLMFLDAFPQTAIMSLIRCCDAIVCAPIEMQFTQLMFWPRPKVLCLLAETTPVPLAALVSDLQQLADKFSVPIDRRPYRPHITLARKATESVVVDFASIRFTAREFVLMQSLSTDNGPVYQAVHRWTLADK